MDFFIFWLILWFVFRLAQAANVPHTVPADAANMRRAPAAATDIDPFRKSFREMFILLSCLRTRLMIPHLHALG